MSDSLSRIQSPTNRIEMEIPLIRTVVFLSKMSVEPTSFMDEPITISLSDAICKVALWMNTFRPMYMFSFTSTKSGCKEHNVENNHVTIGDE